MRGICIVDDMVDTAGTLCKAADVLQSHGARRVFCFASHGVFSGPAPERIAASALTELVVLDTIPLSPQAAVLLIVKVCKTYLICVFRPQEKSHSFQLDQCLLRQSTISTTRRAFLHCLSN